MLSSNNAGLWFRLSIFMLLSAVLALFIGQSFIAQSEQKRLLSYAQDVLAQGVAVAQESQETVQRILLLGNVPCSDADLRELRLLSFYALNLRDVGRIENDRLICSAGWGRLNPPIALLPPDLTTSTGTQLWTAMERLVDPRITADIASNGGVATITASAAFRRYAQPPQGYSATLINKNLDHPYQTFGSLTLPHKEDLSRLKNGWLTLGKRHFFTCSNRFDICVLAQFEDAGVIYRPWYVIAGIILMGAALGGSFTLCYSLYREKRRSLPCQLERALKNDQLRAHYQPLVSLATRSLIGVEALARWRNSAGEEISPEVFVRIAEENGMIDELTRAITRCAIRDMRPYLTQPSTFTLSINLAVSDIISPDYHRFLQHECERNGVGRERVILELTERSTASPHILEVALQSLQQQGHKIALDDFGTGYSNLDYLSRFSFNLVKIDKIFVGAIGTDSVNAAFTDVLFSLVQKLDASIVVEGVETQEQAAYVARHCPNAIVQGWYFGRPTSIDQFIEPERYRCPPIES